VIVLSLAFTYTNGLQDGSSVTAGLIVCRVLNPVRAVILVACCELAGAILGGSAVSSAVRNLTNMQETEYLLPVLSAGLTAAIAWNYLTKALRMPSSSTHALFGGLLGAFLAAPGGMHGKIVVSLFASPLLGFLFGYVMIHVTTLLLIKATNEVSRWLKLGQTVTVSLLAFGHGANDPQKTMGIILMALHASGLYHGNEIPLWVRLATGISIALGVMSLAPGIVKRVGAGIYKLKVLHGFVTEAASGFIVVFSSVTGCPVSTSQVISSTVMGVGSGEHFKDVRWLVARDILISWFLTIPCAGLCAYVLYCFAFRFLDILIRKS
jgi:PiT family inorganic phosphate transporter